MSSSYTNLSAPLFFSPRLFFFFVFQFVIFSFPHTVLLNAFWCDRNGLFFAFKVISGVEVVSESYHKEGIVISVIPFSRITFLIGFSLYLCLYLFW